MKIINVRIGRYVPVLIFLSLAFISNAQNSGQIILLDKDTKSPIIGAAYQYGKQMGSSDANGIITIDFLESQTLLISHISYGRWKLSPNEVTQALKDGQYLIEEKVMLVQPVTILGVRTSKQDPESINIKNQDRLAHDAGDILKQTPLVSGIRKSGSYGFDPVMRGFKYDQINIVIDGAQSATAACPNRMDPPTSQIAPNMISEVEVLKGPHSLRYGTTFGGVINFVTSKPSFTNNSEFYGRVTGAYESNGNIGRTEGLLGFKAAKYDIGVFGSYSTGSDYTDGNGEKVLANFSRSSLGTIIGFNINENQSITLSATHNLAHDVDFPALPMDLTSDDTWMFNAKHNLQLNKEYLKTWNTTVFASFVDHKMDNLLKNLDPRMLNASTDAQTKNYGARTEGQWMLKNGKLYLGADYKVEAAKGIREREFLMGPNAGKIVEDNAWQDSQISKTGIFTEYHFHKSTIMYVMSGRLEVNNAQVSDATPEFIAVNPETSITQINPGVSIGAVKNAKEGFNMGLWLGRAQRSGSLTERYINYFPVGLDPYEMVGNPSILPEVNNQVDINIGYRKSKTNIEVSAFGSYLQDYISSEIRADLSPKIPSSPGVRQFINLDKASMYGFELAWSQILIGGLQHSFNLAYTHGENTVDNEPLPEIAPLDVRYTLSGSYLDGKLNPEISFRYVMQQDRIATSYGETETPAFNLLDFKIEYQVLKTLKAVGGVNNLFDTAYYEHLNRSVKGTKDAINAPGRNVFIMLTLDLM